jgi:hypothetical protein
MTPKEAALVQYAHWMSDPKIMALFAVMAIWVGIWKGIALWKAAKNNSIPWFVALLVVNSVGILEIIYIFFFSKKKKDIA